MIRNITSNALTAFDFAWDAGERAAVHGFLAEVAACEREPTFCELPMELTATIGGPTRSRLE